MTTTATASLADRARELAAAEPVGSLDRRALMCAAVCLTTTRTAAAAREAIAEIGPPDVRRRAAELLADLVTGDSV